MDEIKLVTFRQAMAALSVSRSTIYRLMERGQLQGYKVGMQWRFSLEQLRAACLSPSSTAPR